MNSWEKAQASSNVEDAESIARNRSKLCRAGAQLGQMYFLRSASKERKKTYNPREGWEHNLAVAMLFLINL